MTFYYTVERRLNGHIGTAWALCFVHADGSVSAHSLYRDRADAKRSGLFYGWEPWRESDCLRENEQ
jgi:hypothetical protein